MTIARLSKALFFCACLILSGCQSSLEVSPAGQGAHYWQMQREKVNSITAITQRGRIGVFAPDGRFSLYYLLMQKNPGEYSLTLTNSLGGEVASFKKEGNSYSLFADGITRTGNSIGELFAQRFKVSFTNVDLAAVLLGLSIEGMVYDEEGKPLGLNLSPFYFVYNSFLEYQGFALPSEIIMQSPELELKIAVTSVESIN